MNNLKRNKNVLYLCNRKEENGRLVFSQPIKMELNYQPVSTTGEMISFGSDFINRLIIYTTKRIAKQFHNFDRLYIFNEVPEEYDPYCVGADYYVNGEPSIFLGEAMIYLQKMTGDDLYE